MKFLFSSLALLIFVVQGWAADVGPSFPILENSDLTPSMPSACTAGDAAAGKRGLMSFAFRDSSGNIVLPQLDSSSRLPVSETRLDTTNTRIGDVTETAPASDTASSGLNGRLQRIAQRLTTLISYYASDFGSTVNAIRVAAQLGDGAGNAITSQSYDSSQSLHTYVTQIGASNATHTRIILTANVSVQIAAANPARKWLYIENQSGANVFIKFGTAAVINQAIEVLNNTTFKMSATELYLGEINAIVGSNNRTVEIVEGY